MCGIVGYRGANSVEVVKKMNSSQVHRGPDGGGVYHVPDYSFTMGMQRLAILDISDGIQPMMDPETGVVLVFNGEIFNASSLRADLQRCGRTFLTDHSDTEVILQGYLQHGQKVVSHLNGMFAFTIYDPRIDQLFGSRDRYGIKPLYYQVGNDTFSFASELKSFFSIAGIRKEIDLYSLSNFLSLQFIPCPRTIFKGIYKLEPGSCFIYDFCKCSIEVWKYWVPQEGNVELIDDDPIKALKSLTEKAVERWSISDVPIASSLSGGIDSTVVTAIASRYRSIDTFSLGFLDGSFASLDETKIARKTAAYLGTNHHEIMISEKELLDDIPKMIQTLDEPYAGGLPSYYIYKYCSPRKVMLTGTGGDELFGNYGKELAHKLSFNALRRFASRLRGEGIATLLTKFNGAMYHGYIGELDKQKLLLSCPKLVTSTEIDQLWKSSNSLTANGSVKFIDLQMQLPEEFLFVTDRFSMAFSVEARTPLLDNDLVDFILSKNQQFNAQSGKHSFIKANAEYLPAHVLNEPKRGFILPEKDWMNGKLNGLVRKCFDVKFLERQGLFNSNNVVSYFNYQLNHGSHHNAWTLFMFQLWYLFNFDEISS